MQLFVLGACATDIATIIAIQYQLTEKNLPTLTESPMDDC
jgi:hypothetical protein